MNESVIKNEAPTELFEEYRRDIELFLDKHEEFFKSSFNHEAQIEANVVKFQNMVHNYKTQLQEKLKIYTNKLTAFQQFCSNLKSV